MTNSTGTNRRTLHFSSVREVEADVQSLVNADQSRSLQQLGNWTLGQSLNHLATWADYSFDGVPMKIPLIVRWVMRPMKNRMLYKPMKQGLRIPRIPGGTLAIQDVPTPDAYAHFQKTFHRLTTETPAAPHMFFGRMSQQEWTALHLRHSELHLSLLIPL